MLNPIKTLSTTTNYHIGDVVLIPLKKPKVAKSESKMQGKQQNKKAGL